MIKSRRLIWAGHLVRMEEGRSAFNILTGTSTGRRPLGRSRRRWKDYIGMNIKEIDIKTRIGLIQPRIGIIGVPL